LASDDEFLKQFNEHFRSAPPEGPREQLPDEEVEARRRRELNEKEVKVVGVYEHPQSGAFVLLRDGRGRNLPIWIGQSEAFSISLAMDGGTTARPMSHDLMKLLVERLGSRVEYVLVDDLYNNVFYAKLALTQNGKPLEVDCRPSDSIALGLRFKAPIYVADHVLEEGQWELNEEP